MRSDMGKVLIERPRGGTGLRRPKGRIAQYNRLEKLELLPKKEAIRRRWPYYQRKMFSDLLGPIIKLLQSCVGRPWNDVYHEICREGVDTHFRRHILDLVELHIEYDGNGDVVDRQWGYLVFQFYVDEKGVLRDNREKHRRSVRDRDRDRDKDKNGIIWLDRDKSIVLQRKDCIWYNLHLRPKKIDDDVIIDGKYGIITKKQLNSKEIKRYRKKGVID